MTVVSNAPPARAMQATAVANWRSAEDFERAHRHSKLVAVLRRALPILSLAITIVFVIIVSLSLSPLANLALELSAFKDGKLVMSAPKLSGFDSKDRPFNLVAARAIQDLSKPGIIYLENIDATIPMDEASFADINASAGAYETKEEKLQLSKQILIKGARGLDVTLQSADIDMNKGILTSDQPVEIQSKESQLTADSLLVEDNGKRILFKNNVRMTIQSLSSKPSRDTK